MLSFHHKNESHRHHAAQKKLAIIAHAALFHPLSSSTDKSNPC